MRFVAMHAAAGGVGHVAVQIAKALGAYVIGTASAGNHEFLRGHGADELIDYRTADFAETVRAKSYCRASACPR
jgi:NADPH:quinone reductase-like Zn-dependent oxidoreductase